MALYIVIARSITTGPTKGQWPDGSDQENQRHWSAGSCLELDGPDAKSLLIAKAIRPFGKSETFEPLPIDEVDPTQIAETPLQKELRMAQEAAAKTAQAAKAAKSATK